MRLEGEAALAVSGAGTVLWPAVSTQTALMSWGTARVEERGGREGKMESGLSGTASTGHSGEFGLQSDCCHTLHSGKGLASLRHWSFLPLRLRDPRGPSKPTPQGLS